MGPDMTTFMNLLFYEQIFVVLAVGGAIFFFVRAVLYFISKKYDETDALRALFHMRFGAAAFIGGFIGYSSSMAGAAMPLPLTYAVVSGSLLFIILASLSKPIAIALTRALQKRQNAENHIPDPSKPVVPPIKDRHRQKRKENTPSHSFAETAEDDNGNGTDTI
jgi:hypothetical protein